MLLLGLIPYKPSIVIQWDPNGESVVDLQYCSVVFGAGLRGRAVFVIVGNLIHLERCHRTTRLSINEF
jgi:hypothetical protein